MCTGGHVDLTHPTTLKSQYQPNNNRPKKDSLGSCASAFVANPYDDDEKKESKSRSKSPVKKKTQQPSVMFSMMDAVADEVEDGEEEDCLPTKNIKNTRRKKVAAPVMFLIWCHHS
jgi:hypothetical protein